MEKENRSSMVKKIIISVSIIFILTTFTYAQQIGFFYYPSQIRANKTFTLIVNNGPIPNSPYPYSMKSVRTHDGGITWVDDTQGQLSPLGGQFDINGWDTVMMAYDYKTVVQHLDTIGIAGWYSVGPALYADTTGYILIPYYTGKASQLIEVSENPIKLTDQTNVKFKILPIPARDRSNVKVRIFDPFGYVVKDLSEDVVGNEVGSDSIYLVVYWNGRNEKGYKVANGAYQFCVQMVPPQGGEAMVWKKKFAVVR